MNRRPTPASVKDSALDSASVEYVQIILTFIHGRILVSPRLKLPTYTIVIPQWRSCLCWLPAIWTENLRRPAECSSDESSCLGLCTCLTRDDKG